jgi:protein-L-isoaspartate(D-aspartate) O-methyltransferase
MQGDTTLETQDSRAEARRNMVDGQLRPNRVTDPRILDAMGELPRERFLPAGLAARAYADEDVRLADGRGLIQPMMIARMLQLLSIRDGDRVLVVGAGTGYAAAAAARCGARVVALEEDAGLLAIARRRHGRRRADPAPGAAPAAPPGPAPRAARWRAVQGLVEPQALRLVQGSLASGHAAAAPYDAILIEGEVPAVPEVIAGQLAEGGRLVAVLSGAQRGVSARAVLGRRVAGSFSLADAFDCATLPLPAFQPKPGFVF